MPIVARAFILLFTLSLLLASSGYAAVATKETNVLSLTPTVGGYIFSGADSLNPTAIYGIKLSYDLYGMSIYDALGVEATLNYFTTTSKSGSKSVDGYIFRTDAIYPFFPNNKEAVPFVAAGIGDMVLDKGTTVVNVPLMNFGAGLKYYLREYLLLRADARFIAAFYKNEGSRGNYELTTGLTYLFGKRKKAPTLKALPKPKAIPDIIEEPSAPSAPQSELSVLEQLGALGPAVIGVPRVPTEYLPPTIMSPGSAARAFIPPKLGTTPELVITPRGAPQAPAAPPAGEFRTAPAGQPATSEGQPAPAKTEPAPPKSKPATSEGKPEAAADRRGNLVREFTVEFDLGMAKLKPSYDLQLRQAAALIKSKNLKVRIEGHADSSGTESMNRKLSLKRAEIVKKRLIALGVSPSRIVVIGPGVPKPILGNTTSNAREKNRRASTTVTIVTE